MFIWSWLFPSDADRLRRARAHMAAGRHEKARALLMSCQAPEAEALYDQCSTALDNHDRQNYKDQMAAGGFHGYRVEVSLKNARLKAELEALVAKELERAGIDLGMPEVDQKALQGAVNRAQRRLRHTGGIQTGAVKLVPIVDGQLARQMRR